MPTVRRPLLVIQAELDAALTVVANLQRERTSLRRAEAVAARNPARRLPTMTPQEWRLYYKLRYRNGFDRDAALASVFPSPTGAPAPQPRG